MIKPVFEPGIDAPERPRRRVVGARTRVAGSALLAPMLAGDEDMRSAFAELDPALVAAVQTDHDAVLVPPITAVQS